MEKHIQTLEDSPTTFTMIKVPGGTLCYASQPNYPLSVDDFWMGEVPVTQELWEAVMKNNPARFKSPDRPVETVSWEDIVEGFLPKLNEETEGIRPAGCAYRLPYEAEWQYAAQEGANNASFPYAGAEVLDEVAWYDENSHNLTQPVGLKRPNCLGLYDMTGNVWEWCADWHAGDFGLPKASEKPKNAGGIVQKTISRFTANKKPTNVIDSPTNALMGQSIRNYTGPSGGQDRVYRGGSYFYFAVFSRLTFRYDIHPALRTFDLGFRLVCSPF